MGIPDMENLWNDLLSKHSNQTLSDSEQLLFDRLCKAFRFLQKNPRHKGLHSHEIGVLTKSHGVKVWESYLNNNSPAAGRIFWAYGPDNNQITILGYTQHPNMSKQKAYSRVKLSSFKQ